MRRHLPLVAFLVLALAGSYAMARAERAATDRIRQAARFECERSNSFRTQVNLQNQGFIAHNDVTLRLFIDLTRLSPEPVVKAAFRRAVPTYRHITKLYTHIPLVDCKQAFPK